MVKIDSTGSAYPIGGPSPYQDASAGKAIEGLKGQTGEISGAAMEKAINDATKDYDSQAAGKEYGDLKKFASENWDRLSPDAKEKFRTYEKYALDAQSHGMTGIPTAQYNKMLQEIHSAGYQDAGAGKAIETLKGQEGAISGDDMEKAITDATKDLDSQAAGKEYADMKKFAQENWDRLTPEAREKFGIYEKYALDAQGKGMSGIPTKQYDKMLEEIKFSEYDDKGAGNIIEGLKGKPGQISGADMENLLINGTRDLDGQAAGAEFKDIQKFAQDNWNRLTPEAKEKFKVYEKYAQEAQSEGMTGIPMKDWTNMVGEIKLAGYQDQSAAKAIEGLKAQPGEISGESMEKAIVDATKDLDGQAAGREYADLKKFADGNWDRMSPDAREKFRVYEDTVMDCKARGMNYIPQGEYNQMVNRMHAAGYQDDGAGKAVEELRGQPVPVSGEAMEKAILEGTKDLDNQAAGMEFNDLQKYASANWDKLSPEAQAKFEVYEKYAMEARGKGQTGIDIGSYNKMIGEMKLAGYEDKGAGAAIETLKGQPAPVSGEAMEKAIYDATKDLDAQAAGKEFNDLKEYAEQNWDKLSPDAKEKFRVYEGYAQAAQAKGQTGIPLPEYNKMLGEMKAAGYEDAGAAKVIEGLKGQTAPISGDDMQNAIINATKDLDAQAAGKEFNDLKEYAEQNWDKLSPDAKEKFRTYEKYVNEARANGMNGIPQGEYDKMINEMKTAGYEDAGAAQVIEGLKGKTAPISGDDMQNAIIDATKDLDAQAAGKEFNDLKEYAEQNWDKLSPDAREKFRVYEKHVNEAKANGMSGIPMGDYNKMIDEMKSAGYADAGAGKAIEGLKSKTGEISGADMEKAVVDATKDLDAQAAGKEYADLKKFADENWDKLSPDAKEKFRVYEDYAEKFKAQGMTGIPQGEYDKMVKEMGKAGYEDAGAAQAIEKLQDKAGDISGADMQTAIIDSTKDLDAQAAGKEYRDLKEFADKNWDRMTPDAREKFRVYERTALESISQGQTGIPQAKYDQMLQKMQGAGYEDAGAAQAIEGLMGKPGPVSGFDMQGMITNATKDLDAQAAGAEYRDIAEYAAGNWGKLTPEAKEMFNIYDKFVSKAVSEGREYLTQDEYQKMQGEMTAHNAADLISSKIHRRIIG
jgi:hypothetical protein